MPDSKQRIYHPKRTIKRHIFGSTELFIKLGLLQNKSSNIIEEIRHGFSVTVIDNLVKELQLPEKTLLKFIGLSSSTLARRRLKKHLSFQESNRVYRLTFTYRDALELFDGNTENAKYWLNQPSKSLGGDTPLEHQDTEAGYNEIRNLIGRIEHGIII